MRRAFFAAWREVQVILVGLTGLALLASLWNKTRRLALLPVALFAWVVYFFRDPERHPAIADADAILSPADGEVLAIETLPEAQFLSGPVQRVSIFLSLFDVHVQRCPYAGLVRMVRYQPGAFVPAYRKDAEINEANLIGIETCRGRLAVRQIAGILARRIACWVRPGERLATGQHLGLIRFGSRVELYLPEQAEVLVQAGQKVRGGQTVVARWRTLPSP